MKGPKLNHQIRSAEVRVVQPPLGVLTHGQAMAAAGELGADLIEISPTASPPVCIIQELGKWKYDQAKKMKAQKQIVIETKQVQIRPVTDVGDMDIKARQIEEFLAEGHKVRVVVKLRGRELAHPDEGEDALDALLSRVEHTVEHRSPLEGKQIVATITRKK